MFCEAAWRITVAAVDDADGTGRSDGATGVTLLEHYEAKEDATAWLGNISARGRVGGDEDVLIAGFVATGGNVRLLVRGVGPALSGLGVTGPLSDPHAEIFRGSERIAVNDNWSTETAQAAAQVGAFPLTQGSNDACVLLMLSPGAYTAVVRSQNGRARIGVIEVYVVT